MVDPVTWGALVAIPISGGFVYVEIGKYAAPQVPRSLFVERKVVYAYTAGLFVGVLLAFLFYLLGTSLFYGGLPGTVISLVALVAVLEGAQVLIARSVYFGSDGSMPFYALGYRAGAGGLLGLAVVAQVFGAATVSAIAVGAAVLEALAFVLLLVAGGIQSTPTGPPGSRRPGSVGRAAILEGVGFFLLGLGSLQGVAGIAIASVAIAGGSAGLYQTRRQILREVRPPPEEGGPTAEPASPGGRYGRTDR